MFGMPGGRVDSLLQVQAGVDMAQEELRDPLILLVAAGRAPGKIRLAVAQRHRRRQRGAWALARCERSRMAFFKPEHLGTAAEAKAEFGNHRRGLQPAARRRRRYHVAGLVDDIEMHRVAVHLAEAPDGRLACTHRANGLALPFLAAKLDQSAKTLDRAGNEI